MYHVVLDAPGLAGAPGQLAFSFLDGDGAFPNNVAAITTFTSDGSPGALTLVGGLASGSLTSAVTLQDTPSTLLVQAFSFGTTLSFDVAITESYEPPLFPDQLAFFVPTADLTAHLITTSDPSGANALFTLDVNGAPGGILTVYDAFVGDVPAPISVVPGAQRVPEPATWVLIGTGIFVMLIRLPRATRRQTCTAP